MAKYIRQLKESDLSEYVMISTSSPDISKYVSGLVLWSLDDINRIDQIFNNAFVFAVIASDGTLAGVIHASKEYLSDALNVACFLAPQFRHQGLMNKAMNEFCAFCREKTPYTSITLDIRVDSYGRNEPSLSSAKKIGAKPVYKFEIFGSLYEKYEIKL